jgi:hypothetical protein
VVSICHALGQYCASTAMIYAMHQIQSRASSATAAAAPGIQAS